MNDLAILLRDGCESIASEAFNHAVAGGHVQDLYKLPKRSELRSALVSSPLASTFVAGSSSGTGQAVAQDEGTTKRLRGLCTLLGMVAEVPDSDLALTENAFSVFGIMRRRIEEIQAHEARLNYVIAKSAFVQWTKRDDTILQCQLLTQNEDEEYVILSGQERFFDSANLAIDAAIKLAPLTNDH